MLDSANNGRIGQTPFDVKNGDKISSLYMDEERNEYIKAEDAWDAVQCIEPVFQDDLKINGKLSNHSPKDSSPLISPSRFVANLIPKATPLTDFDEVWEFFTRQDMSNVMPTIRPIIECKGFNGLFRSLFGPKKIKAELVNERNLLFAIAQCPLNNDEPLHIQILMTIYKVLTGTKLDCPRFGGHWDHIGFQGVDPATDLRGVGLLGLVQALYLVTHEELLPLARDIFALSHDFHSQFPLMVLSINVTRISLQALREGFLNKECNSRGNVRHVFNEFFAGVMFHIYWIWRSEHKTIKDSGFLIKDAEAHCKSNVRPVLQRLRSHLRNYSSTNTSNPL